MGLMDGLGNEPQGFYNWSLEQCPNFKALIPPTGPVPVAAHKTDHITFRACLDAIMIPKFPFS